MFNNFIELICSEIESLNKGLAHDSSKKFIISNLKDMKNLKVQFEKLHEGDEMFFVEQSVTVCDRDDNFILSLNYCNGQMFSFYCDETYFVDISSDDFILFKNKFLERFSSKINIPSNVELLDLVSFEFSRVDFEGNLYIDGFVTSIEDSVDSSFKDMTLTAIKNFYLDFVLKNGNTIDDLDKIGLEDFIFNIY